MVLFVVLFVVPAVSFAGAACVDASAPVFASSFRCGQLLILFTLLFIASMVSSNRKFSSSIIASTTVVGQFIDRFNDRFIDRLALEPRSGV